MARRGFKIADAYVEITTDRSALGQEIRDIPRDLGGDADRAGRELGDKLTSGLTRQVEQLSAKITRARQNEKKATDAVTLAQVKLNEAEAKGIDSGSKHLALVQRLEQAQIKLRDAQASTVTTQNRLTDTQNRLGEAIRRAAQNAGPDAERAGRESGDKLAIGMRMAIIRNSPLIAAAIGAALMAGAPVMLGAASVLFGGIAAVAAAQSDEVQSAWLGTWQQIKQGAIADASSVVPIFVGMAGKVSAGFERMRPLIRDAFGEAAPQVDTLVDSLIRMAENALPGIVSGLSHAGPAVEGIGSAFEHIGTGVGQFFDILGRHAPAAGEAFDALGRIIAALLPILAELMGSGAELASVILPPLASILEVVADALSSIAPVLPAVAAGFLALKAAQGLSGMIGGLATSLANYAAKGGIASGIAGKLAGGLGSVASAAGPAAAAVGFVAAAIVAWINVGEKAEALNYALGRAMQVGGEQASAASRVFDRWSDSLAGKLFDAIPDGIANMKILGYSISDIIPSAENAKAAYDEWYASLDDVGRAEEDVKVKTDALKQAVDEHGVGSREARQASSELAQAQRVLAAEQAELEQATRGVTDAMLEQTDASLARADSDLAHRMAVDATEDAYRELQKVLRETPKDTEAVEDASFALERAMLREVAAARQLAEDALPASMDANQRKAASDLAALDALHKLADQYGDKLPASIRQTIADLEASTAGYDQSSIAAAGLVAALGDVGIAAEAIPGEKAVRVEALTDEAKQRLEDLGFRVVQMPDGSFQVIADTEQAENNVGRINTDLEGLNGTTAKPKVDLDTGPFAGKKAEAEVELAGLSKKEAKPRANLDNTGLFGGVAQALAQVFGLDSQRPTPKSKVDNSGLFGDVGQALASVFGLASQRPTPQSGINNGALFGGVGQALSSLFGLGSQRPTPAAGLNTGGFWAGVGSVFSGLNQTNAASASPYVQVRDYASGTLNHIRGLLGSIVGKTVNVVTNFISRVFSAEGGAVDIPRAFQKVAGYFDDGGEVNGPGGPTDDLVPALGPHGVRYQLSNGEHVLDARDVDLLGGQAGVYRFRELLNRGLITPQTIGVAPPPMAIARADGGTVGTATATAAPTRQITVENLVLQVEGRLDLLNNREDLRRLLLKIRDGLVDLEREDS